MFSPTRRGAPKSDPTSSHKKTDSGHSDSSSDGVSSNEEWSAGELGEEEEDDDDEESSPSSGVSSDDLDLE